MPAPAPDHALAQRTLELVDIASESRREAALRQYVTANVPLETAFSDGESADLRRREPGSRSSCWRATPTPSRPRATSRAGSRTAGSSGSARSDMKGGLAVMIELARWAAEAELAYDLALLFFPREELGPAENPLPAVFEQTRPRRRGAARDLSRADRQHAAARLPRQPERAGRLRGPLGALGATVARRQRDRARARRAADRARMPSRATSTSTASSSARCCR